MRFSRVVKKLANIITADAEPPHVKLIKGRRGEAYACMHEVKWEF
jgi:hypothetical protein